MHSHSKRTLERESRERISLGECFVLHLNAFNDLVTNEPHWGLYTHPPSQWMVNVYLILRLILHFQNILYKYPRHYLYVE